MSVSAGAQYEVSQCKVRHARYISYVRTDPTSAGKAYWLSVAADIRLQLVEALDMLAWFNRANAVAGKG